MTQPAKPPAHPAVQRKARLAQALRANLKRRKEAARPAEAADPPVSPQEDGAGTDQD
jgi:hypothetical protein